jgi:hypothetical protein
MFVVLPTETDFDRNVPFAVTPSIISSNVQNMPLYRLVLCAATLPVGKGRDKGVSEEVSTRLQLTASLTCWLSWIQQISVPNTISCSCTRIRSGKTLPLLDAGGLHKHFVTLSDQNRGLWITFNLSSQFLLNDCHRFRWMKFQHTEPFLRLCRALFEWQELNLVLTHAQKSSLQRCAFHFSTVFTLPPTNLCNRSHYLEPSCTSRQYFTK